MRPRFGAALGRGSCAGRIGDRRDRRPSTRRRGARRRFWHGRRCCHSRRGAAHRVGRVDGAGRRRSGHRRRARREVCRAATPPARFVGHDPIRSLDRITSRGKDLRRSRLETDGRRVLGIDLQGVDREPPGARIVATLDGDAGQSDDRDGVERVGVRGLSVEALGLVDEPHRQRPVGLQQELDHRASGSSGAGRRTRSRRLAQPGGQARRSATSARRPAASLGHYARDRR